MFELREEVKKEIQNKIERGERVISVAKKCPKCFNLSLEYNPNTGRIFCTKCGFYQDIPIFKDKKDSKNIPMPEGWESQ